MNILQRNFAVLSEIYSEFMASNFVRMHWDLAFSFNIVCAVLFSQTQCMLAAILNLSVSATEYWQISRRDKWNRFAGFSNRSETGLRLVCDLLAKWNDSLSHYTTVVSLDCGATCLFVRTHFCQVYSVIYVARHLWLQSVHNLLQSDHPNLSTNLLRCRHHRRSHVNMASLGWWICLSDMYCCDHIGPPVLTAGTSTFDFCDSLWGVWRLLIILTSFWQMSWFVILWNTSE